MAQYLDQLGKDILPKSIEQAFIEWCIWQQARPALVAVLHDTGIHPLADSINAAKSMHDLVRAGGQLAETLRRDYKTDSLRGLFAARGAAFEFVNMLNTATEAEPDAEAVAFFAVRVCGWRGWAQTGFSKADDKQHAEDAAREAQSQELAKMMSAGSGI